MRENFWSTRTEGNPQMWHNIRSVAEALAANDVVLANAILEVKIIFNLHYKTGRFVLFCYIFMILHINNR